MRGRWTTARRSNRRQSRRCEPVQAFSFLSPEVSQRGRWRVLRSSNAKLFGNALPQKFVYRRHAGFAIEFQEIMALGDRFEFPLDHGLVTHKRPVKIVRKRHITASFPIADRLRFAEFPAKRGFRAYIQPESKIRPQRHRVKPAQIIAVDSAHHTTRNEREDIAVGQNYRAGFQRRYDA